MRLTCRMHRMVGRFEVDGSVNRKLDTRVMAPATLDLSRLCDDFTANPIDVKKGLGGLVRKLG